MRQRRIKNPDEKMEYLSKNVRIMIGNVYHKRFQAYCVDGVSFNDAMFAAYRLIVSEWRVHDYFK